MAYQTGTATDAADLYQKLIDFLTTDAELVGLSQNWAIDWEAPSSGSNMTDIVLRGPGLAADADIYVGLRLEVDSLNDAAQIFLYGMTGTVGAADDVDEHVNVQTHPVRSLIKDSAMDYWFVASGRRFCCVFQVGTVYSCCYGGFFLPYGTPTQYPYPMFIGGDAGYGGNLQAADWRSTADDHAAYPYAHHQSGGGSSYAEPSAWMLSPSGGWLRVSGDHLESGAYLAPKLFGVGNGIGADIISGNSPGGQTNGHPGYDEIRERMIPALGGNFCLTPITLVAANPSDQTYGLLDGIYHVPGRGNSIENEIDVDGTIHLTVIDTFRTAIGSYWAMALKPNDSNSTFAEDSNS